MSNKTFYLTTIEVFLAISIDVCCIGHTYSSLLCFCETRQLWIFILVIHCKQSFRVVKFERSASERQTKGLRLCTGYLYTILYAALCVGKTIVLSWIQLLYRACVLTIRRYFTYTGMFILSSSRICIAPFHLRI